MHRSLPPQLRGKGPGLLVLHTVEGLGFSIGVPFKSITLYSFLCFTIRIQGFRAFRLKFSDRPKHDKSFQNLRVLRLVSLKLKLDLQVRMKP